MIHTSHTYVESQRQMSEGTGQLKMYTSKKMKNKTKLYTLVGSGNPVGRRGTRTAVFLSPLYDDQYPLTVKTMGISNTLHAKLKQEAKEVLFVLLFLQS